ncbi:MAG: MtnX-like HAD-IB family phosphatase [Armatimonadota bacterium]|nr:MtnX-like HAD-IB family phosphatase [Armatimonadota bacterium]
MTDVKQAAIRRAQELKLRPGDLVMSDFDGTITKRDTGWVVFDTLGLDEAWDFEYRWRDREISSIECLEGQWGLVDVPRHELLALIDSIEVDERFLEFVRGARDAGAEVVVASDGLSFYLDRMLQRIGLEICDGDPDPLRPRECITRYVNRGELIPQGVKISFPHSNEECMRCGNCKTDHLKRLRLRYDRVIYIGDGYSDRCPAREADVVFAKDHLAELLAETGVTYIPFEDFGDVIGATLG